MRDCSSSFMRTQSSGCSSSFCGQFASLIEIKAEPLAYGDSLINTNLNRRSSHPAKFDGLKGLGVAETSLGIENFKASQATLLVVVSSNTFGQMLRCHSCVAKDNTERINFRIVFNLHNLKIIRVDRDYNYLVALFDEDRANLLELVLASMPLLTVDEVLSTLETAPFIKLPLCSPDDFLDLLHRKAAHGEIGLSVTTEPDRFHGNEVSWQSAVRSRQADVLSERMRPWIMAEISRLSLIQVSETDESINPAFVPTTACVLNSPQDPRA